MNDDEAVMSDAAVLSINSPSGQVRGPYAIVYKDTANKWAIVAMGWINYGSTQECPRLGIRWFWGKNGYPNSRQDKITIPMWFVLPQEITKPIMSALPINHSISASVEKFLSGEISGDELKLKSKGK